MHSSCRHGNRRFATFGLRRAIALQPRRWLLGDGGGRERGSRRDAAGSGKPPHLGLPSGAPQPTAHSRQPAARAMAVAPPSRAGGSRWTWRPVARDALLARAFHSCTELRGRLYLVGGLLAGGAREPSGDTVVFDPAGGQAVRLGARSGPRRSHHDAAPLGGRWLCAVGGWDGSRRLATVAALDTERGEWEAWTAAPDSCLPAGLSSHTCTRLSERELRGAGREGGTRTPHLYEASTRSGWTPAPAPTEEGCHTVSRSGRHAALLRTPGPHPSHQLLLLRWLQLC